MYAAEIVRSPTTSLVSITAIFGNAPQTMSSLLVFEARAQREFALKTLAMMVAVVSAALRNFLSPPPEGGLDLVTNRQGASFFHDIFFNCPRMIILFVRGASNWQGLFATVVLTSTMCMV